MLFFHITRYILNSLTLIHSFRYLFRSWIRDCIAIQHTPRHKFWCNGPIFQFHCPPGKMRMLFVKPNHEHRIGDKPFLKEGRVSPTMEGRHLLKLEKKTLKQKTSELTSAGGPEEC